MSLIKYLILIILVIGIILLLRSEKEKRTLSINRVFLSSKKITKDKKLIFLSDLHNKEFGENNIELINLIKKEKPDYILIGGDILVTKRNKADLRVLENLLLSLSNIAQVIYANGNHEQRLFYPKNKNTYGLKKDEFINILNKVNATYLSNSNIELDDLVIYGLNIDEECYKDFVYKKIDEEDIKSNIGEPDKNKFNILLGHSPLFLDKYSLWGADLSLSGHFHGGVLRIGKQGVLTSQWGLFHKWCTGTFKINDTTSIVSRGLGGHTINVRLNNLPELTVIELKKD